MSSLTDSFKTIRNLELRLKTAHEFVEFYRNDNARLKERWEQVLQACCNAEAEVEHLQNQIEVVHCQLTDSSCDAEYLAQELNKLKDQLAAKAVELGILKGELYAAKTAATKAQAEVETKLAKLAREYATLDSNYKFAIDHKQNQDKLIADAGGVINQLREQIKVLKSQQVDQEHLAKKLVQTQGKLVEVDALQCPFHRNKVLYTQCGKCTACKLQAAYDIIERQTAQIKNLEREVSSQNSRITNNFDCANSGYGEHGSLCGGCLTCLDKQTHHILDETVKNFKTVKESYDGNMKTAEEKQKHQVEIIKVQTRALETISQGAFFKHAGLAAAALKNIAHYKSVNGLNGSLQELLR